jgi:hypothetical protein
MGPGNPYLPVASWIRSVVCIALATTSLAGYPGQPAGSPSPPVQPDSRHISVHTDKPAYSSGEIMRVRITNNLDRAIFAYDQKALCTVLTLERRSMAAWREVRDCLSTQPPKPISIIPHTTQTVPLDFRVLSLGPPSAGTYRFKLVFQLEPYDASATYEAYSPAFLIK